MEYKCDFVRLLNEKLVLLSQLHISFTDFVIGSYLFVLSLKHKLEIPLEKLIEEKKRERE